MRTIKNEILVSIVHFSGFARIGALITPFIAQVLIRKSQIAAASTYGVVALIAAVACALLPIETKGRDMPDTSTSQGLIYYS